MLEDSVGKGRQVTTILSAVECCHTMLRCLQSARGVCAPESSSSQCNGVKNAIADGSTGHIDPLVRGIPNTMYMYMHCSVTL